MRDARVTIGVRGGTDVPSVAVAIGVGGGGEGIGVMGVVGVDGGRSVIVGNGDATARVIVGVGDCVSAASTFGCTAIATSTTAPHIHPIAMPMATAMIICRTVRLP